jgi:L-alanine-DL-glutamate epimerase-like enolase superfamily enzyme
MKVKDVQIIELLGKNKSKANYIKVLTDAGPEGIYGPIDNEAVLMINSLFKKQLIGQDPLAIEDFWQRVYTNNRHSRGSYYSIGMSAIDNVLWDLKGKYLDLPVFRLLGGGTRTKVRAYASCLGYSLEPPALQERAKSVMEQGFNHQKWFLTVNPSNMDSNGLERNVEIVRLLRETVGSKSDLMFDASTAWDLSYAVEWAKRVEQYYPRWLEEPFQVARLESFKELSRETSVALATGEHFYGRWDIQEFLNEKVIRVVQADPEWCGGVSELIKICDIASVYGAQVIPHGHSMLAAMHVVASQPEIMCPLVEFLILKMTGDYQYFDKNPVIPQNGMITLSERPGFGIELDDAKIESMRIIS